MKFDLRRIQHYIEDLYSLEDEALAAARDSGVPDIGVTPMIGRMLSLFVSISGARRILEIGTLGGYSTIWMGRALPEDGALLSLEIDPAHAEIARQNLERADLSNKVTVQTGNAHAILPLLPGPFDLIFLDADKQGYPDYLEPMLRLLSPGGLLLSDNLIRKGKVIDPRPDDPVATALSRYNQLVAAHPDLQSVILPTLVGYAGGHPDGLGLAIKGRINV